MPRRPKHPETLLAHWALLVQLAGEDDVDIDAPDYLKTFAAGALAALCLIDHAATHGPDRFVATYRALFAEVDAIQALAVGAVTGPPH